ncbi:MAG TPA: T9SS type A sorting domain-containing protein [Bacteroidia bacterium]|jgi:hypothetical protein|nr:T9SS type A sorting domain-containing protein [Bacteroidia bacterium]
MKKRSLYLLLFCLVGASYGLKAQVLVFSPHHILGFNHSVVQGTAVTDSVYVKDSSLTAFSGSISFKVAYVDSSSHALIETSDSAQFTSITITAGHTYPFTLHRTYNTSSTTPPGIYKTGINVIVIWPACYSNPSVITKDTLRDTVFVSTPAGIAALNVYNLFSLYPNPSTGILSIGAHTDPAKEVEEVVIYDDKGRVCARFQKQSILDLSALAKGGYLVEVIFRDGSIGRRKLLLE